MLSLFWGYSPQTLGRALNALHPHLWTRLQILSNNFPMMIVCIDVNLCEKGDAFEKYPPNVGRGLAPAAVWKYICMQMSATLLLNIRYRTCLSADPCFSSCRRKTLPSSYQAQEQMYLLAAWLMKAAHCASGSADRSLRCTFMSGDGAACSHNGGEKRGQGDGYPLAGGMGAGSPR